jgi:ectoine hydroxylase-related dioxygenase (phytanoyl-CoA dioxygenase family)
MLACGALEIDTESPLSAFEKNGYARLGPVLSPEAAESLRDRANALMLGELRYPGLFYQHDSPTGRYQDLAHDEGWVGPSLAYRKLEKLERDSLFCEWIENPLFARIARDLLGEECSLYRAVLWNKAPHAGMDLPWHQDDGPFWGLDRPPCLQIWTALDPAPANAGCLEVVPGSHLAGLASPVGGTVQQDRLLEAKALERRVFLPAAAGEAILIHNHLWHRSGRNTTGTPRRAIGIAYLSAATRCTRTRRAPREFKRLFTDLSTGLRHAGVIGSERIPGS